MWCSVAPLHCRNCSSIPLFSFFPHTFGLTEPVYNCCFFFFFHSINYDRKLKSKAINRELSRQTHSRNEEKRNAHTGKTNLLTKLNIELINSIMFPFRVFFFSFFSSFLLVPAFNKLLLVAVGPNGIYFLIATDGGGEKRDRSMRDR